MGKDTLENRAEDEAKKRVKLPVYHSRRNDDSVTINFRIHPRKVERFTFLVIIIVLLGIIYFQPDVFFGPREWRPVDDPVETGTLEQTELVATTPVENTTQVDVTQEPVVEETPPEPVVVEPEVNETEEEPEANIDTKIYVSKLAFQITDFTVEKKSETWFKLYGIEVKVTNNNEAKFYPQIKAWYFDDATKFYFNEDSPPRDEQVLSIGIDGKKSKTFTLSKMDESFSGSDLHPTVLVKLYDFKTGKLMKELTEEVEFDS